MKVGEIFYQKLDDFLVIVKITDIDSEKSVSFDFIVVTKDDVGSYHHSSCPMQNFLISYPNSNKLDESTYEEILTIVQEFRYDLDSLYKKYSEKILRLFN